MRFWKRRPSVIDRQFEWLLGLGYEIVKRFDDWGTHVTYARGDVLVGVSDDQKDDEQLIAVARRLAEDVSDEPWWARVHLGELLDRRAPDLRDWSVRPPGNRGKAVDAVFARGAELLQTHFADLLDGQNLDLLDEIIAKRPRYGVPGLDFPTDEPWAASAEGAWFTTDYERLRDLQTYLERSRSEDPTGRVVAALKIVMTSRTSQDRTAFAAGHDRLHEMLADPVADVRRAAASALGEWEDLDSLDDLLTLLDDEPGDTFSPIAAAATFIVLRGSKVDKQRVLEALDRFAARDIVASDQVAQLAWRLDRSRPGYPDVVKLWRDPDEET